MIVFCDLCGERIHRYYYMIPICEKDKDIGKYCCEVCVCNRCLQEKYRKEVKHEAISSSDSGRSVSADGM